ncbi:MAG: translation initiation factor IF-2 N-terminal domain-containing protein, partial [Gemmataceae bacterium]
MQKDKVRVYELARKLNVETKDLLDMCKQAGLDVKNQLSSLDPEQRDAIEELVKRGGQVAVQAAPSATATLPEVSSRVRNLNARPRPAPRSTPTTVKPAPPTPVVESPVTKVEPSAKPVASPVSKPAVESKPPVESKP